MYRLSLPAFGVAQIVAVFAMIALLTFWPPAAGPMMVVPLKRASQSSLLNLALAHEARLLGTARGTGFLIIDGDRDALAPAFWSARTLLISAPAALCSTRRSRLEGASST
jgi:hypothetical protein